MKIFFPALALALIAMPAKADSCAAAVLTGVDSSTSVDQRELRVQLEGIQFAVQSPEFLQTIQRTAEGCVLFGVFLWASNQPVAVLNWTVIGSDEDAKSAADALRTTASSLPDSPAGIATDTSSAIDFAAAMFGDAPMSTDRQIFNLLTDATPNTNPANVPTARAALLATGAQINGVAIGGDQDVIDFLRVQVVGGPGAFVMSITAAENMAAAMVSKFRMDISMVTE